MTEKPDWANAETIVWCRDETVTGWGLIIQRGDLLWEDLKEADVVRGIKGLRDLRRAAEDYPWLNDWYDDSDPTDDQELVEQLDEYYNEYRLPVPWDGERVREWLPPELADYVKISGASPGGNMDCASWSDDAVDRFVALGFRAVEDGVVLACLP